MDLIGIVCLIGLIGFIIGACHQLFNKKSKKRPK